jgi:hypothetical protein
MASSVSSLKQSTGIDTLVFGPDAWMFLGESV